MAPKSKTVIKIETMKRIILILTAICTLSRAQQAPKMVRVGALFDAEHEAAIQAAFAHGVNLANDDRSVLFGSTLTAAVDTVLKDNSFKASEQVCQMLQTGVTTLFGPTRSLVSHHVQSMSTMFEVPHVEIRWDYAFRRGKFSINVHPHPRIIGRAFSDLISKLGWKSFVVVYQDVESLVRLQEVFKLSKSYDGLRITFRQLSMSSNDYRPMLKAIQKSGETRIVLDCQFEMIDDVLRQADDVGIITDYYNYLITSLDMERVDLTEFKYNNVNMTSFRLLDTNAPALSTYLKKWNFVGEDNTGRGHPLFSSNILMFDAVQLASKAMDDLGRTDGFVMENIDCRQPRSSWRFGSKLISALQKVEYTGLTGEVLFDNNGFRTQFQLDLLEKQRDLMMRTGTWTPDEGINITMTQTEIEGFIVEKLQNKTLKITVAVNSPFIIRKSLNFTEEALARMSFEEKYEGYVMDLVKELANKLKFKYKFYLVPDGNYGVINPKTGEWNGLVRELIDQKADMAVMDVSITSERQRVVDFTLPFMTTGVAILYKKKAPPAPNLFSFLLPMSAEVWICMTTLYLAISILMFVLARVLPQEWDNPHPCDSEPSELHNILNVKNSMWFGMSSLLCQGSDILPKVTPFEWDLAGGCDHEESDDLENTLTLRNCFWHNVGSVMQQGSDIAPKAISTRMVASMWWFFTLIMISSYTANLAAFLTAAKMESPINSAEDLAKQTKIKYGTYCCGSTNTFFKTSTIPTIQKLNAYMESAKPSVYTGSNQEGIDRVNREDGQYAFFIESATLEYHVERNCDLVQIGDLLDNKGYGIALPADSPYTQTISNGILDLQEKGVLQKLKFKWWKEKHGGGQCVEGEKDDSAQLGVPNLGGVFISLIAGLIISILVAITEFVWKNRILLAEGDDSYALLRAMWIDFKFAINPWEGDTKPITKGGSRAGSKSILSCPIDPQFGELDNSPPSDH